MSLSEFANLGNSVLVDMASMLCGDLIAAGSQRSVYACRIRPDLVIKIETNARSFQNIEEYNTWNWIKDTDYAKWFAPVEFVSSCGILIMQKRTEPGPMLGYPSKMPAFFTDMKYQNFGWLGKQMVCHDYGINLLRNDGLTKRMRKVRWWDGR